MNKKQLFSSIYSFFILLLHSFLLFFWHLQELSEQLKLAEENFSAKQKELELKIEGLEAMLEKEKGEKEQSEKDHNEQIQQLRSNFETEMAATNSQNEVCNPTYILCCYVFYLSSFLKGK